MIVFRKKWKIVSSFLIAFSISIPSTHAVSGKVFAWGEAASGVLDVPTGLTNAVAVAGGGNFGTALRDDGTIISWAHLSAPSGLSNVIAIAAQNHCLALKEDGLVVDWNSSGQTQIPECITNIVDISAGDGFSLALKADGTVTAWGNNPWGQTDVPVDLTNVVSVAAGLDHSLALLANGSIICWGRDNVGQLEPPTGATNVIKIAAGGNISLALTRTGDVFAWGYQSSTDDSNPTIVPPDLHNVVSISSGATHCMALTRDGQLVFWGDQSRSQGYPPSELTNAIAISCGGYFNLAIGAATSPVPQFMIGKPKVAASGFSAEIQTERGKKYTLEWTDSLSSGIWTMSTPFWGNGQTKTLSDLRAIGMQRFYRVLQ